MTGALEHSHCANDGLTPLKGFNASSPSHGIETNPLRLVPIRIAPLRELRKVMRTINALFAPLGAR